VSLATVDLPSDPQALRAFALACQAELKAAQLSVQLRSLEIEKLKFEIARRLQFGRSSERITRRIEQLELPASPASPDHAAWASAGAGAWVIASHALQAYFGRTWRITWKRPWRPAMAGPRPAGSGSMSAMIGRSVGRHRQPRATSSAQTAAVTFRLMHHFLARQMLRQGLALRLRALRDRRRALRRLRFGGLFGRTGLELLEPHPARHMAAFSGFLQADGYAGFEALFETARPGRGPITEVACWAHCRRKFFDVWETTKSPVAKEALERIGAFCGIEEKARFAPPAERLAHRTEAGPLLDSFFDWAARAVAKLSAKSALAEAFRYAIKRREALSRFITDARLEMTTTSPRTPCAPSRSAGRITSSPALISAAIGQPRSTPSCRLRSSIA
jgi:hypothetical protein